ncbi:LacI family DNA-binding transcriptional regulator [Oceanicella sp. SM1341]|uniref:LacI family DNA-binding transcriptional regulator n=1 Tax=Oceanicella sp. SM1341 TaxID=1548889 RepID=UPI000E48FCCF|nr:LacI family DNA-binding transcriptional regulator [Oceanicella sp. SM1341]
MRKPTLHDVARAAGVSYATADRVLNARGGVAAKSEARVRAAIEALGYTRDVHAANLSRRRLYRFRFLLPDGDHSFFRALRAAVLAEAGARAGDRVRITLSEVPAFDAEALAEALERVEPEACDGLAIVASGSARVSAAIASLRAGGVAVVTLVSDAPGAARDAYVGIDNLVAGRTAGRLMRLGHTGRSGLVLPVVGARAAQDHAERLAGLEQSLAGAPGLALLPVAEAFDSPSRMRALVGAALAREPGISGIYSMGAGNRGLVEALRALGRPRPLVVLHELVPHAREALEAGLVDAVIDQKPVQEVAAALDILRALADGRPAPAGRARITPAIYLPENLPACPAGEEEDNDMMGGAA